MSSEFEADQERRVNELRSTFGEFLTMADLAKLLRYPTLRAAQKARLRGSLDIPFIRISGRRGWFAPIRGVADYLRRIERGVVNTETLSHPVSKQSRRTP